MAAHGTSDFSVLYCRVPRLLTALTLAHGDGRHADCCVHRVDVLILDDFGPEVLTAEQCRDLLEIVEDRYNLHSLLITSQIPIPQWHDIIGNSTLADAILDRVVHNAYRIELSGETLRDRIDDTIDGASPPHNQTSPP
jgi:DNA replication protein DnaC